MRRTVPILAAALVAGGAAAAEERPALSPGTELTPGDVARVVDAMCLTALPHFDATDARLDASGFRDFPTVQHRPHPEKPVSVTVISRPAIQGGVGGSCLVAAEGLRIADLVGPVAPLALTRLGADAERREQLALPTPRVEWVGRADGLETWLGLFEQGAGTLVAVIVRPEGAAR